MSFTAGIQHIRHDYIRNGIFSLSKDAFPGKSLRNPIAEPAATATFRRLYDLSGLCAYHTTRRKLLEVFAQNNFMISLWLAYFFLDRINREMLEYHLDTLKESVVSYLKAAPQCSKGIHERTTDPGFLVTINLFEGQYSGIRRIGIDSRQRHRDVAVFVLRRTDSMKIAPLVLNREQALPT